MELKDFARETLKGIVDGVSEAQPYALSKGDCVNPINMGILQGSSVVMQVGNPMIDASSQNVASSINEKIPNI